MCVIVFSRTYLTGHRAVYIGVHVPFGKQGRRRHRHRGHRHHRRKREKETDREDGRESPSYGKKFVWSSLCLLKIIL